MQAGQPSKTALGAAALRAAHQVLDHGRIFTDPLASRILGANADTLIREAANDPSRQALRLFIAVRSRFAEDAFEAAFASGVRQLVVLGAGLDTYAYRSQLGKDLRVFEVDHPATQAWKRQLLMDAAIPVPRELTFAPVDFERERLADGLATAGFDPSREAFYTWLGVVPYLTRDAVFATLGFIASAAGGAHVVFDYANCPASIAEGDERAAHDALSDRVASVGEAFRSYFDAAELSAELRAIGFGDVEDLGPAQILSRFFPGRVATHRGKGGHLVRATTRSRA